MLLADGRLGCPQTRHGASDCPVALWGYFRCPRRTILSHFALAVAVGYGNALLTVHEHKGTKAPEIRAVNGDGVTTPAFAAARTAASDVGYDWRGVVETAIVEQIRVHRPDLSGDVVSDYLGLRLINIQTMSKRRL